MPFVMYFPPRPVKESARRTYEAAVKAMVAWASDLLCHAPRRTTPIFLMDLNDGVGLQRVDGVLADPLDDRSSAVVLTGVDA